MFSVINFVEISHGYSIDYFADIIIGNIGYFILTASSGTAVIVLCSKYVTGYNNGFVKNSMINCVQSSLSIYGLHYIVLAIVYQILKVFSGDAMCVWGELILMILETGIVIILILLIKYLLMYLKKYN